MSPVNNNRIAHPVDNQVEFTQGVVKLKHFEAPVTSIHGVGSAMAGKLEKLGISTVGDLLYHLPRKYLDRSTVTPVSCMAENQEVTVVGKVCKVESRGTKTRKQILTVTIFDGTGYISGVWFNQDYHKEKMENGTEVSFSGKARFQYGNLQIVNPDYDVLGSVSMDQKNESIHTGRIIPVYASTAGLTSAGLRRVVTRGLDTTEGLVDPVPEAVRKKYRLMDLEEALREVHFPTDKKRLGRARYRVNFEEIFFMQVGLALKKKYRSLNVKGKRHRMPGKLVLDFIENLPFQLTESQRRAWAEISFDMVGIAQMNRLLQGEVGSGKTVVALMALLLSIENGFQGAIMSPTEVLAEQHFRKIKELLGDLPVSLKLVTSGTNSGADESISEGKVDLVIGTHALIQEKVRFADLGLAVIDEQQRFGLNQREDLVAKGEEPDVLHMSATPIPRTLAMTAYGDLDITTITDVPKGRKGVVTVVADEGQRQGAYAMVRKELQAGRQVFVICPMIEESGKLELRTVEEEARKLAGVFAGHKIGLLHGRMESGEKTGTMRSFERGEIEILISTVVVEVGIDVPNATVMIIENADRFGLAQLHQLRGRVGRGRERAVCVLFAEPETPEARARMEAIGRYNDGFSLAEADLQIRGEGALFGIRQSGYSDVRVSKLIHSSDLIKKARKAGFSLIDGEFEISQAEKRLVLWEANRRYGDTLDWLFKS
ncbi:MAG: ATP-dependent DNA helicase RecG [Actinobacteria bacterium]|nr:ATP-dependent DNA helicase RecG [Actinomycetota bacterium]